MDSTNSRNSRPSYPVLFVCLMILGVVSARAQSGGEAVQAANIVAATASPLPTHDGAAAADEELRLVVALFRHGVRAPSKDFNEEANKFHSGQDWPTLRDWNIMGPDCDPGNGWAYLTRQGQALAQKLGKFYGEEYKKAWRNGFKVYLWADDENQRTRETANALGQGFVNAGIPEKNVTVASLSNPRSSTCQVDLLFHPFKAGCGKSDIVEKRLSDLAQDLTKNWDQWVNEESGDFKRVGIVLNLSAKNNCQLPIGDIYDKPITGWSSKEKERKSPIKWEGHSQDNSCKYKAGRFPFGSGASEAFFLEYANNMPKEQVGWGNVFPFKLDRPSLQEMLRLHEFYFDKTDRDPRLAQIQGSNLLKEILDLLRRKAGLPIDGCPHAVEGADFVGLVGHDTNIANVSSLLGLGWGFRHRRRAWPANHAFPAGALVFELRERTNLPDLNGKFFVRVYYITQSPFQMRNLKEADKPPAIMRVRGDACGGATACDIPLPNLTELVNKAIGDDRPFNSRCVNGKQVCP